MSNEHKHILVKINPTRHPIPSPTTSWSWPCAPSTSCRWRCYPPGIPRTNPTYGRRRGAHRSSRSIPHWPGQKGWWLNQPAQRDSSISIIILLPRVVWKTCEKRKIFTSATRSTGSNGCKGLYMEVQETYISKSFFDIKMGWERLRAG